MDVVYGNSPVVYGTSTVTYGDIFPVGIDPAYPYDTDLAYDVPFEYEALHAFGLATLTTAAVIRPVGIDGGAVGAPTVTARVTTVPVGIASAEAFGTLKTGFIFHPVRFASTKNDPNNGFGSGALVGPQNIDQTIGTSGLSGGAFGKPQVTQSKKIDEVAERVLAVTKGV